MTFPPLSVPTSGVSMIIKGSAVIVPRQPNVLPAVSLAACAVSYPAPGEGVNTRCAIAQTFMVEKIVIVGVHLDAPMSHSAGM